MSTVNGCLPPRRWCGKMGTEHGDALGHMVQMNRELNDTVAEAEHDQAVPAKLTSLLKTFDGARRKVQEAEAEKVFAHFARRGVRAGWLSAEQVREVFAKHPTLLEDIVAIKDRHRSWERVMLLLDGDANGAVSKAEFYEFYEGYIPPTDIDALFREADRNNDRVITALELTNACNRSPALQRAVGDAFNSRLISQWTTLKKDAFETSPHSVSLVDRVTFVRLWASSGLSYAFERSLAEKLPASLCAENDGYEACLDNQRHTLRANAASYSQYRLLMERVEDVHRSQVSHLSALFGRLEEDADGGGSATAAGGAVVVPTAAAPSLVALREAEEAGRAAVAAEQHTHFKFLAMGAREAKRKTAILLDAQARAKTRRA